MSEPVAGARRLRLPRGLDLVCAVGLLVGLLSGPVLTGLTPSMLAHHDTVLEALSSSAVSTVTGGALARVGRASLLLTVLAPLCGIALFDWFFWLAGRRWGEHIVTWLAQTQPRNARLLQRADRWIARHGMRVLAIAYFLPVPNPLIYLSSGMAGLPLAVFVIGDAIGTLLWTGLLVELGWQLGHQAVSVVNAVNHYELELTIAIVLVIIAVNVFRQRRQQPVRPS